MIIVQDDNPSESVDPTTADAGSAYGWDLLDCTVTRSEWASGN